MKRNHEAEGHDWANLGPSFHGFGVNINVRIFQPGKGESPYVLIYRERPEIGFNVSLHADPLMMKVVAGNPKGIVTPAEFDILLQKTRKYRLVFLRFWNDPGMTVDDLMEEMARIGRG